MFQVNLKACLGLIFPNQYCLIVIRENQGWFLGDVISWATPTPFWSLLYSTIVPYDNYDGYYKNIVLDNTVTVTLTFIGIPVQTHCGVLWG